MRCDRCGNQNPDDYKYCGNCGALMPEAGPTEPLQGTGRDAGAQRIAPAQRPISGPSFLGLGTESTGSSSSRDVEYLLEDDQSSGHPGRFLVLFLILAAAGAFAWLKYTPSGKAWLPPWEKPATQAQNAAAPSQAAPPAATEPAAAPAPAAPNQAPAKAPETPASPPAMGDARGTTATEDSAPAKSSATEAPSAAKSPAPKGGKTQAAGEPAHHPAATVIGSSKAARAAKSAKASQDDEEEDTAPAKAAKAPPSRTAPPPDVPSPDDALVANAERYLYGRGVPRNCDRAVSGIRTAAGRQSARARTLLGTMYATGHCVPRDLPSAYRWFALALRDSPDNLWVQRNLELVWREMTPQERKLATSSKSQ